MRKLMSKLWNDDGGAIIAAEFILVATILVLGLVVGYKTVQFSINSELTEVASAFGSVSQAYSYCGTTGLCSVTQGSSYHDTPELYSMNCSANQSTGTTITNTCAVLP